jgi:hypothetical protein
MSSEVDNLAKALERSSSTSPIGRTNVEKLATIAVLHDQVSMKLASVTQADRLLMWKNGKE